MKRYRTITCTGTILLAVLSVVYTILNTYDIISWNVWVGCMSSLIFFGMLLFAYDVLFIRYYLRMQKRKARAAEKAMSQPNGDFAERSDS